MADTDWNLALDNYADDDFDPPAPPEEEPAPSPAEVDRFRGMRLVPIPARMKGPREPNWQTTVYDHADVRAHVASGGNFGVLVGPAVGLAILDVDPKNGGLESFARLQADLKLDLSGHLAVITGGLYEGRQDGRHYLMRLLADGRRFRKDLSQYPGIEFRAQDGLQCCAVSSLHEKSGLPYRWTPRAEAAFWFPAYDQERPVVRNGVETWEYNYSPQMREWMRLAHEDMGAVRCLLNDVPAALLDLYAEEEREPAPSTDTTAREPFSRLEEFLDQLPIRAFGKTKQFGLTRDDWLGVGQALHYETDGSAAGLDLFTTWSKADPNYAAEAKRECAKVWKSCKGRPHGKNRTAGFLGELVKRIGGRIPPPANTLADDDFDAIADEASAPSLVSNRPPLSGAGLTDTGNAARFVLDHRDRVRFVQELESWVAWDGRRWAPDLGLAAERLARDTVGRMERETFVLTDDEARGRALRWTLKSYDAGKLAAMVRVARADLALSVRDLDAHPHLLNVANGTLDLRTGKLEPHNPGLLLTKLAPTEYRPGARCARWEKFLEEVLPDELVRACFQRFTGYALGGGQQAKAFCIALGPKDSGKSTGLGAIADTLGADSNEGGGAICRAYVATATMEAFGGRRGGGNSPDLARLVGVRVVIVNEVPEGRALESSAVKAWTGGDTVNATPKYGHPLSFRPDGTLVLVGNVMPGIDFADDAMWERVIIFPFEQSIPEERRERGLRERFDRAGILVWLVEGYRAYREHGLQVPDACRLARATRRAEADPLADFWADSVVERDGGWLATRALYLAYRAWASAGGITLREVVTQRQLTELAAVRFGAAGKRQGHRGWPNLALREQE